MNTTDISLLVFLIGIIYLAAIALKLMEKIYEAKSLKEEIFKKDALISIYTQRTSVEENNKITDIYRVKTEPERWIPYSASFVELILEEDISVDSKFHNYIKDYIESHPETHKLPGSRRYL